MHIWEANKLLEQGALFCDVMSMSTMDKATPSWLSNQYFGELCFAEGHNYTPIPV